jgi:hypothetical protein
LTLWGVGNYLHRFWLFVSLSEQFFRPWPPKLMQS